MVTWRMCATCNVIKDLTPEFWHRSKTHKHGLTLKCKTCLRAKTAKVQHLYSGYSRASAKTDRGKALRARHRLRDRGGVAITLEEVLELKKIKQCQNRNCGRTVEEEGRQLAIDHCHTTKRIRGVLCARCNNALGYALDSPEILQGLIDYLANT